MNEDALSQLYLKDTAFQNLMQQRIFNVLLVASPYDAFIMEEDGRIEEQLYFEYVALNLSSPPRVTRVSDTETALDALKENHFGLVIMMPGMDVSETFAGAKKIKAANPQIPIVVLTPFSKEVSRRLADEDLSDIDYVFSWLGNVDLLLAIIKLLEDKMNADNDINVVGVQMIMVIEDSVRFYSSVLPQIYKNLLKQSYESSTEALNEHEQMLRMRGRPKVLMARTYEEALSLYERYGESTLGVISDVSFMHDGVKDSKAGLKFAKFLRDNNPYIPIIIESSELSNKAEAEEMGCVFLDKNSKKLPVDLSNAIKSQFGFGDFVMTDPETGEEIRLTSLKDLQYHIYDIPASALFHHASTNDISRWLYSRALFPIAEVIREHRFTAIEEAPAVRKLFFDLIVKYRRMKNRGVVAVFRKDRFDHYSNFARIGQGSLGGKGRGLAFIDQIIKHHPVCDNFEGMTISIPRTVVVCSDIFDEFMASNNLYPIALSESSDEEILSAFLKGKLPDWLKEDLNALFEVVDSPLAIRSSSLLEDSHYQPFAGIYSTYMIPRSGNKEEMLRKACDAIKGVYASVFYADSKAYMTATSNVIDQEKMAVIIQEVIGREHENYYYPSFSGVGRSINYYPVGREEAADGVAEVAVGLGKYIVDGGLSLRFSPKHPDCALQTSELQLALKDTQTRMYALALNDDEALRVDDGFNIAKLSIQDVARTGALKYMVSTFDWRDNLLRDTEYGEGRKVVTFNNILKHKALPLAPAVDFMLTTGAEEMRRPVEIEFAGLIDSNHDGYKGHIFWLQIRPIADRKENFDNNLLNSPNSDLLMRSSHALGNGTIDNLRSIVYINPDKFSFNNNDKIARELEKINRQFMNAGENYLLVGPGRWGSSDKSLGIPVKWPQISCARIIVEVSTPGTRIEPSQGTHFFQNLTSLGVGYFTISDLDKNDYIDFNMLNKEPTQEDWEYVKVMRLPAPVECAIDGRKGIGVVSKPK